MAGPIRGKLFGKLDVDELVELYEKPMAEEVYMLAGWHQWADAGAISSGLPEYLVGQYDARKIGEIHPDLV